MYIFLLFDFLDLWDDTWLWWDICAYRCACKGLITNNYISNFTVRVFLICATNAIAANKGAD